MDPDAALQEIRELTGAPKLDEREAERLRSLVEGLDQWLSSGGFLPSAWAR